ncbi:MAG: SRPBCC family protein [Pseudomonadota bacterium]
MRLEARTDLALPVADAFAAATDFTALETAARARGIPVSRLDTLPDMGPGMVWNAEPTVRGRPRRVTLTLGQAEPPERLNVEVSGKTMRADCRVEFVALAAGRSRILLSVDIRARSFSGRAALLAMTVLRGRLGKRLKRRLDAFGKALQNGP